MSHANTRRMRRIVAALALVGAILGLAAAGASAATITVDSADDDGTAGDCELREAIGAANGNLAVDTCAAGDAGPILDRIEFDIDVDGSIQTIFPGPPQPPLPALTDPVEIDGRNNDPAATTPRIQIDAGATTSAGLILSLGADGSQIHHLAIFDSADEGIRVLNDDNRFERLAIGLDADGDDQGNGDSGIAIFGSGNTIRESVISANSGPGIEIANDTQLSPSTETTIEANRIGTTLAGTGDLGNGMGGITVVGTDGSVDDTVIGGAADPTPGGACDGECNVISGNTSHGIDVRAPVDAIDGVVIRGNHLGTDDAGTAAIANALNGIKLGGPVTDAVIRGNLISGNAVHGIGATGSGGGSNTDGPSATTIAANRIGVDREGDDALPNAHTGIRFESTLLDLDPISANTIGGTADPTPGGPCDGDCNVIAGNAINGITLLGAVDSTSVLGNHLGADAAGTGAVANGQNGITLSGVTETTVGAAAAPNLISGNSDNGVQVIDDASAANRVESNLIGTAADGVAPLGNGESGVQVFSESTGVAIGGAAAGAGNTIAHNAEAGVFVGGGSDAIPILGNSIGPNGGLGIDLLPDLLTTGVTPNDGPGDADTGGGNDFQNFPELDSVTVIGSSTLVDGRLESTPSDDFRVELFATAAADPSGHGEGEEFLGAFQVSTDGTGVAVFSESIAGSGAAGRLVSATATVLNGSGVALSTSELSANVLATTAEPPPPPPTEPPPPEVPADGCSITGTEADDGPAAFAVTAGDDVICGFGGDDVIPASGGDDLVIGGAGADTIDYSTAPGPVSADLATGRADADGAGAADLLDGVEHLTGSAFADLLGGDAGANAIAGLGGDDELTGSGDSDEVEGGAGRDRVEGGGGAKDEVRGQGGDDTVKGGGGKRDEVRGGGGIDKLDGGGGTKDDCDGGGGRDRRSAPGCETKISLP